MSKFTLEDITKLVNEELGKYSKKQALISEKAKLESELKTLSEVVAGKEMKSDKDYHQGQKEPAFEKRGSHIVEDSVSEGLESMVKLEGEDVTLAGTKVGEMQGGEFVPMGDEFVMKAFSNPEVRAMIAQKFASGEETTFGTEVNVAEMEHDINDATMENAVYGDEEELQVGTEFMPDMADPEFIDEPEMVDEKSGEPNWMKEGEMEEEVDLDAQIKGDLEEMMEPDMAEEISETISEIEDENDEAGINPADYSGLGENDFNKGGMDDMDENVEPEAEFEETFFESVIDKRRKSIMSESMQTRMRVLSGQDKRWDSD